MSKPFGQRIAIVIGALLLAFWTLMPFYWALNMSLKWHTEILDGTLVPRHPTLANYLRLFDIEVLMPDGTPAESYNSLSSIRKGLWNSFQVAAVVTVLTMFIATPCAYVLGRLNFKRKTGLLLAILLSRSYPPIAMLIPFFGLFLTIGLMGKVEGLILIYCASIIPLIVWIMTGLFAALPRGLEASARSDGCTRWSAFWRVMVPSAGPGLAACVVIAFLASWNEFTFALILSLGTDAQMFPLALTTLFFMRSTPAAAGAAIMMSVIPILVLASIFQSRIRSLNNVNPR